MSSNKYRVTKRKQDDFIFCCMIGQCGIVTDCNTKKKKKKKKFAWRGTCKFSKKYLSTNETDVKSSLEIFLGPFSRTAAVTI